ncbi:Ig-like domain-containing protein [Janthinobacterium sp. GB4P2]|uniref:Ig-like domain-containing protein n=1 Tax=Janthinobacterium sp. GB4P2 TaxID=3424189 RepID=UPI003F1E6A3B
MSGLMSSGLPARWALCLAAGTAVTLLAGCGGGGSASSDCSTLDPSRNPNLPGCVVPPVTPVVPVAPVPVTLALSLKDGAGKATTSVSPGNSATVQAVVKDGKGAVLPGVLLTLNSSDKSASFTPGAASALTDANGVASIVIAAGSQSGAFALTASATVNGSVVTSNINYTVVYPTLTLGGVGVMPATLSAGGTAGLSVTVMNGAAVYAPVQSVVFSSPCASAGKAVISSPVNTVNGVASTSYIDKGCGAPDVITASTVFNATTLSQTGTLTVQTASAGQIGFVSALPQNIALKGTGGAGRQESSVVTFKVLDRNGNPVSGKAVNFSLNTTAGGLSLNPAQSTSGADGSVSTTVASGTMSTPIRVTATLQGTSLSTVSDQLVVSTGISEQDGFTLSTSMFNTEGGDFAGCAAPTGATITVRLGDHFRNPVPDGTAVSFTAEGGTVDASCLTGLANTTLTDGTVITQKGVPGSCSVHFCPGNPRPLDGRVTILAVALGEESFVDANGNNLYDAGESYVDLGEPFRNDRAIVGSNANFKDDAYSTGNAVLVSPEKPTDSNGNGIWDQAGDGQYNGIRRAASSANTTVANTVHIRQALVQVLSGSTARITPLGAASVDLDKCVDGSVFENRVRTFPLAIRDSNDTVFAMNRAAVTGQVMDLPGNPLPAGTTISFSASNGSIVSGTSFVVPSMDSASSANWIYPVQMISDVTQIGTACQPNSVRNGLLTVTVRTPNGILTSATYGVSD